MKNLISNIRYMFSEYNFFKEEYLCGLDIAMSRFVNALKEAREYYEKDKVKIRQELIHDKWQENIETIEAYFTNEMDENFISQETINGLMVFTNAKAHKIEMKNIAEVIDAKTVGKIISNNLNSAFIKKGNSKKDTIINSVNHLHHLMQFERVTKRKIGSISSIVEFGGGYGNLTRIANNVGYHNDYYIIDLLLMSCIQYVFLCTVFGKERISFYRDESIRSSKIVLYPLSNFDIMKNLHGELFISTWALSESPRIVYESVVNRDWFDAKGLLLAYNNLWKPWQEGELEATLKNNGWCVERKAISFLPGNFYLFATR